MIVNSRAERDDVVRFSSGGGYLRQTDGWRRNVGQSGGITAQNRNLVSRHPENRGCFDHHRRNFFWRRRRSVLDRRERKGLRILWNCLGGGQGGTVLGDRPFYLLMAEREGFEPSVELPLRSLSKGVLSTTQPPFQETCREGLNHKAAPASILCQ